MEENRHLAGGSGENGYNLYHTIKRMHEEYTCVTALASGDWVISGFHPCICRTKCIHCSRFTTMDIFNQKWSRGIQVLSPMYTCDQIYTLNVPHEKNRPTIFLVWSKEFYTYMWKCWQTGWWEGSKLINLWSHQELGSSVTCCAVPPCQASSSLTCRMHHPAPCQSPHNLTGVMCVCAMCAIHTRYKSSKL